MSDILEEGLRVLDIEAQTLLDMKASLDENFVKAVELILECNGKIILAGMGKSGQVARKICSTFSSTGTPAVFLHPAESSHGDLGVISENDLIIAISYGGEAEEMMPILQYAARKGIDIVAISGDADSTLAKAGKVFLNVKVKVEACPLGLAPTSSSTATLALGDAMAMAVLKKRGFNENDFAEIHPGGKLGRRLLTRVKDVMHTGDSLPVINEQAKLSEVLSLMTAKEVRGVAGVINTEGDLIGAITDGDIRRRLKKEALSLDEAAEEIMSQNPKTIDCNELAQKALFLMEQFRINTLFAVDKSSSQPKKPVGVLHIQDLLNAKIK